MPRVSKAEWRDWIDHPVTIEFMRKVKELREEHLLQLAHGLYAEQPGRQTILIGVVNGFTKILDVTFQEEEQDATR